MSWKKHFRSVINQSSLPNTVPMDQKYNPQGASATQHSSYLPQVYAGHPNRIQRYYQYDDMDRDSDINAALDTIADFCTQSEEQSDKPFDIIYAEDATETEIKIIGQYLEQWIKMQNFRSRLWNTFRNTVKNGDQIFLRDPETLEWLWVDPFMVEMVKVDDTCGKKPDEYVIRGLEYNKQAKFASIAADPQQYRTPFGTSNAYGGRPMVGQNGGGPSAFALAGNSADPRSRNGVQGPANQMFVVDAKHVIHLSLSVGMDINYPFGASILEPVFKTFKQKELLEDSIIIYRVQRAPERRIFYIDVGAMPPPRAKAHIEQIKNEIHQRRIPGRCLSLKTNIILLDGRSIPLSQIIEEHNFGKQNWVYSCNPDTGAVVPGKITWAGPTRSQAQMVRLTLDNGKTIECTPDHKFPILGKGFVEAQNLVIGESFIPLYQDKAPISDKKKNTYTRFFDNVTKQWDFTHRMVANFFKNDEKYVDNFLFNDEYKHAKKDTIHHINYDRYDNSPENLCWINDNGFTNFEDFREKQQYVNHKLVSIEWITELQDTGTITVDGDEEYHNYHTFALEAGVFTKNSGGGSSMVDAAYNPLCLDMETKIPLLDGRTLTIRELSDEYREGKENWIYSCDPITGKIVPGNVTWAGVTRESAKVIKITLDNGETLITTPDHKIPVLNKGFVEAQNLTPEDSLIALYTRDNENAIEEIFDHEDASWIPTKNMIGEFFKNIGKHQEFTFKESNVGKIKNIVFNKNFDLRNNDPRNISWMNDKDYTEYKEFHNHRIISIEWLDEPMQVGTITVDGKERWNKHHTFATAAGIFVKNSMIEDYFFAQNADGRGSKVEVLPGGDQTGDITDLSFFAKKMARALRIPPSYLSIGDDSSQVTFNDGKLGAALIQEYRFNKYCMRLQALLSPVFDKEFKYYLEKNGIAIETTVFELRFNPPQNFTKYRQIELDMQQMQVYTQIQDNPRLSERFKLIRFLNLTEEELLKSERMLMEENPNMVEKTTGANPADTVSQGLSDVGVGPSTSEFGVDGLDDTGDAAPEGGEAPPEGAPGAGSVGGAPPGAPPGGEAPPPG